MASHIQSPTEIAAAGTKPKIIEEFFGRVNSNTSSVSIALMKSPSGWEEPAQIPEFQSPGHKGLKVTQVLTLWGIMRII
jgi:hypothetical protein